MSRPPVAPFAAIAGAIAIAVPIAGYASRLDAASTPTTAAPSAVPTLSSKRAGLSSSTARSAAVSATALGATGEPRCEPSSIRISLGDPPSAMTGEHGFGIAVTNAGQTLCHIGGYPQIRLTDTHGVVLPMIYVEGGGYLTTQAPTEIPIAPGDHATIVFAKYRCDTGDLQSAAEAEISVPGAAAFVPLHLDPAGPTLAYCGPNDPGDKVDISPIEPGLASALFSWPPSPPSPAIRS
jgi:hypothetical protein